jgi:hypothetical protein
MEGKARQESSHLILALVADQHDERPVALCHTILDESSDPGVHLLLHARRSGTAAAAAAAQAHAERPHGERRTMMKTDAIDQYNFAPGFRVQVRHACTQRCLG